MFQVDERHQSTDSINSTFPKQSDYTGNIDELNYGLKTKVNVKYFRDERGQISKKKAKW